MVSPALIGFPQRTHTTDPANTNRGELPAHV